MAEIIKKGTVPSRIKFMLMDVQDLRANNWVQRSRQESSLKTIDQVRGWSNLVWNFAHSTK